MDQLIKTATFVVVGLCLWKIVNMVVNILFKSREDMEFDARFREHLEQIIHIVNQEKTGDMIYWYDNDNGQFIAQGVTWDEMVAVLRDRFPEHIFVLNDNEMIIGPEFELVSIGEIK